MQTECISIAIRKMADCDGITLFNVKKKPKNLHDRQLFCIFAANKRLTPDNREISN